jgi:hypothetical protein
MMMFSMMLVVMMMIDAVEAVDTSYLETMFGGMALCTAIVAVVAGACSVDQECDEKFFADMKTEGWNTTKINMWLDDVQVKGGMKTAARNRLLSFVGKEGSSSSTAKASDVKIEPEIAAEKARAKARTEGKSDDEIADAGKIASVDQMEMNEKAECTSVYARALRSEGGEGVKIDRALMGEDCENEMVENENGLIAVKRPTSASVADKWKTMEEAQEGISEMQQRAAEDGKFHIVSRLRSISDHLMMISLPKRLPYVKRLFKSFYQGIPVAYSEKVMRKVNNDWEAGYSSTQKDKNTAAEDEMKSVREENARLKKKLAGKEFGEEKLPGKDARTCHLCKQTGHMIADCPDQCTTCSSPGKQIHKKKCECVDV